jgi:hypothetical protein
MIVHTILKTLQRKTYKVGKQLKQRKHPYFLTATSRIHLFFPRRDYA